MEALEGLDSLLLKEDEEGVEELLLAELSGWALIAFLPRRDGMAMDCDMMVTWVEE